MIRKNADKLFVHCLLFLCFECFNVFVLFAIVIAFHLNLNRGLYQERFLLRLKNLDEVLVDLAETAEDNFAINLVFFVYGEAFNY